MQSPSLCRLLLLLLPQLTPALLQPSTVRFSIQHSASAGRHTLPAIAVAPAAEAEEAEIATAADAETAARDLLMQLGSASELSAPSKADALDDLMKMEASERDAVLDAALDLCSASAKSKLGRWRLPIRLPSKRATIGCFRRLMEQLEDEEPGAGARFRDSDSGRRRRFMLVLFRQARESKSAWSLEREAKRRREQDSSMAEMLRRTPDGLETPAYEVLSEKGSWEVRRYANFSVVTTLSARPVSGGGMKLQAPTMPAAGAFQALAGYIFGGNGGNGGSGEKMAMTTPVISRRSADGADGMEMSFVMPSKYWEEAEEAPPPLDDSGVQVRGSGGGVLDESQALGTLWFGGFGGPDDVAARKKALLEALAADEEWEALPGEPVLMQYNDPFTPPWKRRNEVAVPVKQRA